MTLPSLLERVLIGTGAAQRRREIDGEISRERENLAQQQTELESSVRQNQQIWGSVGRVFQNMTHAMAMMEETERGKTEG